MSDLSKLKENKKIGPVIVRTKCDKFQSALNGESGNVVHIMHMQSWEDDQPQILLPLSLMRVKT